MSIAEKLTQIAENEQKVYDSGYSKAERNFFDGLLNNGARTSFSRAFAYTDFSDVKLPYVVKPTIAYRMFYAYQGKFIPEGIDFSNLEGKLTTNAGEESSIYQIFAWAQRLEEFPDTKIPVASHLTSTFDRCRSLKRIAILRVGKDTEFHSTFVECIVLTDITIDGVIGRNGFNISWSPLSHDSLMSIINALADYSADTSGTTWTVTLGSDNLAKLTEEEQAIATSKGWVLA